MFNRQVLADRPDAGELQLWFIHAGMAIIKTQPKGGALCAMKAVAWLQMISLMAFTIDLSSEFPDPRGWVYLSLGGALHLAMETGIMVLLMLGFVLARQAMRRTARERDRAQTDLRSLRGDFDAILRHHFARWKLTPTQTDVALLVLRGLTIEQISQARVCAAGTVKAHLNAIYRAGGFATRGELVGFFMDELLDHGANGTAPAPQLTLG